MVAPTIRTDRLVLRAHSRADYPDCCALWGHPDVARYTIGRPSTPEEVWSRLLRYVGHWDVLGFGYFVVTEAATGAFMGEVGLADYARECTPPLGDTPEAGWVMLPAWQGQGFAREALNALLDWADGQAMTRTVCLINPDNAPSLRLAQAVGYAQYAQGTYKDAPIIMLARG